MTSLCVAAALVGMAGLILHSALFTCRCAVSVLPLAWHDYAAHQPGCPWYRGGLSPHQARAR